MPPEFKLMLAPDSSVPADLQAWALANRKDLSDREFLARKSDWYEKDGGGSTVSEVIDVIEAAAAGSRICGHGG